MQQAQIETGNLEQVARDLGFRWGLRLREQYIEGEQTIGTWPGTLEQARKLIEASLDARVGDDLREALALMVERGARRAWHASDQTIVLFE